MTEKVNQRDQEKQRQDVDQAQVEKVAKSC